MHDDHDDDEQLTARGRGSRRGGSGAAAAARASQRWQRLVEEHLPVVPATGGWRYSRPSEAGDPAQGWKLHVSATLPEAVAVFEACAGYLTARGAHYKSVRSLDVLAQLNSAIPFGFSQIGKFITVYPGTDAEAVEIAGDLDRLTAGVAAPAVPFDVPLRPGSSVHYRYGAFGPQEMTLEDGTTVGALTGPDGSPVPDRREPGTARPDWVPCPFPALGGEPADGAALTPLQRDFLCYEAMMQRGKGGVYRAVRLASTPARLCVVKEGRRHGETGWDRLDGYDLVAREEAALRLLRGAGVDVPAVLDAFEVGGHRYLAMEHVDGTSLHMACSDPGRRLPVEVALAYAAAAAGVVAEVHERGWVWRDCKPANLLVDDGRLRPVDFEGAWGPGDVLDRPWGTPGYTAPEARAGAPPGTPGPAEDLYSLGATIHQLLTSWLMHTVDSGGEMRHEGLDRPALGMLRTGVPAPVARLVASLLDPDPDRRPSARAAAEVLEPYRVDVLPDPVVPEEDSPTVARVRRLMLDEVRQMVIDEPDRAGAPGDPESARVP